MNCSNQMKALTLALVLGSILTLTSTACQKSDNGGPAKTPEEILKDEQEKMQNSPGVADATKLLKPYGFKIIKENLTDNEANERYQLGCEKPGLNYPKYAMDKQLKLGMQFGQAYVYNSIERNGFDNVSSPIETESRLTKVSENSVAYETNFLRFPIEKTPFKSIDELFSGKPHSTHSISFDFSKEGYPSRKHDDKMNLTDAAISWLTSRGNQSSEFYWDCHLDWNQKSGLSETKTKYDLVSYSLPKAPKVVVAVHWTETTSGPIICEKFAFQKSGGSSSSSSERKALNRVEMGEGTRFIETITSNEVIETGYDIGLTACGGARLYLANNAILKTGKIIQSNVDMVTTAPIRP